MNKLKGVSPVVAEVLLMGIAISAAISAGTFLQGTLGDVQENAEDQINLEERQESTSIGVDFGYNGSNGYLLMDVRNTGSYTLAVEENNRKNWNLYIDGIPSTWNYTDPDYIVNKSVSINPQSTITVNTTEIFPTSGNSLEARITGPYNIQTTLICFSEGGRCT